MPKPKRPKLYDEHPTFSRDNWRSEVASNDTHLGYWEWVQHQLERCGIQSCNALRQLPAQVASVINPFDLWGMPHAIQKMPEAAQFVQVIAALAESGIVDGQWDLIAEKICIPRERLEAILDLAGGRTGEIIKSVDDHNS